jgi:hypothetical protein
MSLLLASGVAPSGVTAVIAVTQDSVTASITADAGTSAAIGATQGNNTSTVTVALGTSAAIGATQGNNTASISVGLANTAAIAVTQGDNTASITGSVTAPGVTATITAQQDDAAAQVTANVTGGVDPMLRVITANLTRMRKTREEELRKVEEAVLFTEEAKPRKAGTITLAQLVGKTAAAQINGIDLEAAIQRQTRATRKRQDDELLMMM